MEDNFEITLDTPIEELQERLLSESNADEVNNIIDIFNLNIKKKNVIRTEKLSQLQDLISEQMKTRVEKNADAFSNKDLLEYFKTIQDTISKSDMSSDVRVPVQINQQQINVNVDQELDRASKNRVLAAIESILTKQEEIEEPIEEVEVIDNENEEEITNIELSEQE